MIVWTLGNIREKIRNHENVNAILSDCFYNTRPGYNISLKIYPNGDGTAKDKFISIYFVIHRGEYDDKLSWPFQNKLHLSLLSSDSKIPDITHKMSPDHNIACYGRPDFERNRGAGQVEFVPISEILDKDTYLHGNALKIQFSVTKQPQTL